MQSFIAELKRRNVFRVAAFYAAAAWLLVQVVTQVLPVFDVSALVQRIMVLVLVAGFPAVLALSWIYELTPHGIVKTDAVPREQSITRHTGQLLNRAIIAVLGIAVLVLLGKELWLRKPAVTASPVSEAPGAVASDNSIAVLPFENLSRDPDNAYFAVGIQDEILTRLAKIGALKVISRTSTQHYQSTPDHLPEIARQLGVANILEGSVQKAGDAVHINVQLIRAVSDEHIWAESYNRKLTDIFGVEGEVAGAIAAALKAQLTGSEQQALTQLPTSNDAAYDAYLRGLALYGTDDDDAVERKRASAFGDAVRLDPQFAQAWAQLAITLSYLYFNEIDMSTYTAAAVQEAANHAMALQPQSGDALLAQGMYLYRVKRDYAQAYATIATAVHQSPNNAYALENLGYVSRRLNRWDEAVADLERAAGIDPHNLSLMESLGETLQFMLRFDAAREWQDRALSIEPHASHALSIKASTLITQGRLQEAQRMLDDAPWAADNVYIIYCRDVLYRLQRHHDLRIAVTLHALTLPDITQSPWATDIRVHLGYAQLMAGRIADAQASFQQAITELLAKSATRPDSVFIPQTLAYAYNGLGKYPEAEAQARIAVERSGEDAVAYPAAVETLATVLAWAGRTDQALAELAKVQHRYSRSNAPMLQLDPLWDPLRKAPGFEVLVADGAAREAAGQLP